METITSLASQLPGADRVTVGMPGMIRHGVVIATPHYITKDGPRSRVLPDLVEAWYERGCVLPIWRHPSAQYYSDATI